MAKCDLCRGSGKVLYPLNVSSTALGAEDDKHLCKLCIEQIQMIHLPKDGN